jgi:hypothetical protein
MLDKPFRPARHLRTSSAFLVAVLLLACPGAEPERITDGSISLERTPCFGWCPVYKVVVERDGGVSLVATGGEGEFTRRWRVSRDAVAALERDFAAANFFGMRDVAPRQRNCTTYATDHPTIILHIADQMSGHRVEYYTGCLGTVTAPAESLPALLHAPVGELATLTELAARVDTVSGAIRLIDSLVTHDFFRLRRGA